MYVVTYVCTYSLSLSWQDTDMAGLRPQHVACDCHVTACSSSSCRREIGILLNLFSAQLHLGEWEYLPSLMQLVDAQNKINKWIGLQSSRTAVSCGPCVQPPCDAYPSPHTSSLPLPSTYVCNTLHTWRIDLDEHIHSRINQFCMQLTKAYVAKTFCKQLLLTD